IQGSRDRHKSFPILRGHYKSKKLQITVRPRQDWLVFQDLGRHISGSFVNFSLAAGAHGSPLRPGWGNPQPT
ncbi:MAG: hypothetical protein ACK53L_21275, partial [Pirellulaceae bacterium]